MVSKKCFDIANKYMKLSKLEGNVSFDPFNEDIRGTVNINCTTNADTKDVTNSLYYLYANNYVDYAKPFTIHSGNIQPYKLDSFLEFVISRVVHHIFPKNFPKYSLFYQKNDEKVVMEAVGYIKEPGYAVYSTSYYM